MDNELVLKVKPGMFRGKGEIHRIPLDNIISLESKTGVKPFTDALWVLFGHTAGSIEFFSENKTPLREITETVSELLEAKALKLKEDEALFEATRESHVALIMVNLELIDALMKLCNQLNGQVDWGLVEGDLIQVEAVMADRVKVPNLKPATFKSNVLRKGVEKRLPYVIKQEVHDMLSLILQESTERAIHLTSWFPSDLHNLFISASLTLWNLELAGLTGVESVDEQEAVQILFDSLHRAIVDYTGKVDLPVLSVENKDYTFIRSSLYHWVEMLLDVPFSPEKE
jgi:hypothetical protein